MYGQNLLAFVGLLLLLFIVIIYVTGYYCRMKVFLLTVLMNELDKRGFGYGSALVDTYFYGYLKIILPDDGTKCMKGIEERIKHYILDRGLSQEAFPVHKLFLLVTSSGFSPPDLSTFKANGQIERRECLTEEPKKSRNGVKDRIYRSSVYKVFSKDRKRHVSVVMEAAPTLRPLYDAAERNPDLKILTPRIVDTFIKLLQRKLDECADCRHKCEIIYCDATLSSNNLKTVQNFCGGTAMSVTKFSKVNV
ncbi:transmembrane protein sting isoform X1 [Rhodnius prolixus]|uniref:transmembrane protein sting isoform X1 n=1 Tax=Rhodnius prolixus TaxID=13249 RepID=UPI003D18BB87